RPREVHQTDVRPRPAMPTPPSMSGWALLASGKCDEAKPLLGAVVGVNMEGMPLAEGALSSFEDTNSQESEGAE
ncbi:MAG: hypothetical protein VXX20_09260, partial [Verrucomicrobiota bacterium]|nr:hypothetical protein [Verrucomicrobiota bacterium]